MNIKWYNYPNRTLCDTLKEMRDFLKVSELESPLLCGLIEEAQTYGNRMESALEDWSDVRSAHDKLKGLKNDIRAKESKLRDLEIAINDLEEQRDNTKIECYKARQLAPCSDYYPEWTAPDEEFKDHLDNI